MDEFNLVDVVIIVVQVSKLTVHPIVSVSGMPKEYLFCFFFLFSCFISFPSGQHLIINQDLGKSCWATSESSESETNVGKGHTD